MDKRPTISVILSSYNCAEYIGRTLNSIIAQTYIDWEAVVVDDGSSDNSRDVILEFARKDSRIKPFLLEKNLGMCSAFNFALERAQGEYFARIDDDDFWEPKKLEIQLEYMQKNPKCGVCFTWVRVVDEHERIVPSYLCEGRDKIYNSENRSRAQWLRTFFVEGCRVCHPTALIRREAIQKVGKYNYIYKQIQDYDLWIRIAKHYDIYVIPQKLINYRWFLTNRSNVSASNPAVRVCGMLECYLVLSKFNEEIPDELFYEAFHEDFFDKKAKTHEEIACERAFLMYHKSYMGNPGRAIGSKMLDELINDAITKKILEQTYQFTTKKYAEFASYPLFSDCEAMVTYQENPEGLTLKNLVKKWLFPHKRLFAFFKTLYQPFKRV